MSSKRYRMPAKDVALIFLHIPKTGGTTLHSVIDRQYPKQAIFHIKGTRVREYTERFKSLPEEERANIWCLKGHMPFGLHTHLPQPSTYITMLRDPIDRMISHYYFVKKVPSHKLHKEVISRNMSLEDYVASGIAARLNDGQVKLISGAISQRDPASIDALEAAKRNLREFFVAFGLMERFDESLILFGRLLGWKSIYYVKRNVTKTRPSKSEISPQTLKRIESYAKLDMELYEFAKQRFEDKLHEQDIGRKDLLAFRLLNQLHTVTHPMQTTPARGARDLLGRLKFAKWAR